MRNDAILEALKHGSFFQITVVVLLIAATVGCHKREDGLVYEDDGPVTSGKSNKKAPRRTSASKEMMYGRVVDRNDQPLRRVTIQVSPGSTELISNKWGEYEIDGLHNEDGSPMNLKVGQEYTISAWKPGYHETTQIFRYEGEVQEIPTITLIEDTVKLEPQEPVPMVSPNSSTDDGPGSVGTSVENE